MRFLGDGVIAGVGAVAVFFPQIMILFFLMTLLEDSGYLARGATLVDRPLSYLGLHGRSFVPMLSGFACAIPAVFAARAIPARRERLLTIWILPLMSCSARLPVYALLLAALLPAAAWQAGLGLAAIYVSSLLIGSLIAGIAARIFMKHRQPSLLAMELPAYRVPRWWPILRMTWARGSAYLKRAGRSDPDRVRGLVGAFRILAMFRELRLQRHPWSSLSLRTSVRRWSRCCGPWAWTGASASD